MGSDGDVAVIGGGLAGLAAARHLQSRGRQPVVFESTERVGGRQRSSMLGGTVLEEGAVFFGNNYPNLWRCITHFRLDRELKTYDVTRMGPIAAAAAPGSTPSPGSTPARPSMPTGPMSLLSDAALPSAEKLGLIRLTAKLAPRSRQLRRMLGNDADSPWLRHLDDVDAATWFEAEVGPRLTRSIVSPILESLSFGDAHEWSALGALMLLAFSASKKLNGIIGGNDRVALGLAEKLAVRTNATVTRLAPDRNGVTVEVDESGATSTLRFGHVVLAVPGPVAASLADRQLGSAIAAIRYSPSVVPAIVTESPLAVPASSFYEDDGRNPISGLAIERPLPGGPILCFAALRSPWREDLLEGGDDDAVSLLADVIEAGTSVRPLPCASKVIRWRHSIPIGEPGNGVRRRKIADLAAGVPHLVLAGDYLVSPSQEGALVSGVRAANSLL